MFGQGGYNLPSKKTYEKATIGLADFTKIEVAELRILNDSIKFFDKETVSCLHLDEINYIRVMEGRKTRNGALIGGASLLLISIVSILQTESDPNYELRDNVAGLVGLYTLGGTAVGALIGTAIQRKTSYYIHAIKN